MVLISQEKLLLVPMKSEQQIAVHGFEPKEALEYATRLGIDLSNALPEFALLSVQLDGHPVMLRAVLAQLPQPISKADISNLTQNLPNVTDAEPFIQELSARIFFGLVKTNDQRKWIQRLSTLTWFDKDLGFKTANISPTLDVGPQDWLYLCSVVFDQSSPSRYTVPQLIRHIASGILEDERKAVLITSARYVFGTAIVSHKVDFWDFQGAIFNLLLAGRYEEAAFRFLLSFGASLKIHSFGLFEFLFVVLNSEAIHMQLPDPVMRWSLLQAELVLRLNDPSIRDQKKVPVQIFRRMRASLSEMADQPKKTFGFPINANGLPGTMTI
jgi:hypothetical protein